MKSTESYEWRIAIKEESKSQYIMRNILISFTFIFVEHKQSNKIHR